ncbi:MAG: sulfurtransferase TusA family protein [Candidatus Eisenbacteria bacterium]|uniref:Sulfurtransferase TusA family protein n=1 Tax=Eiseniibacteriota bacterium TaxID=2212470 RepID=A0A956M467_UNCEI|nr:sulfurtransferase TusA family protein [Candidatus Eisenbacteria bacterium]
MEEQAKAPGTDDVTLDCRALRCPMPIVRISQAIKQIGDDQVLIVEATDPAFAADVRAWADMTGNILEDFVDGEVKRARIRRRAAA